MRNYLSKSHLLLLFTGVLLTMVFIVVSCNSSGESFKPRPLGAPGEVLLVIDDSNWNSPTGNVIGELLEDAFPALPQVESMFKKTRIDYSQFKRHFRTYRNILLVSVKPDEHINRVEYRKNEWALSQQVAEVIVNDPKALKDLIEQKWPTIKSFFYTGDIDAMVKSYSVIYEPLAVDAIKENYPFNLYFPRGYEVKKQEDAFSWLAFERLESHLGIFVYQCSLDSVVSMDARDLLQLRNNVLMQQVPGENPGSFMTTEESYPVLVNKSKFGGRKWIELRGLWKVQGDFMGGPFVDYFYADVERNQLIMLEGYVYAPSKANKALFVREVEAVLKSFIPVL